MNFNLIEKGGILMYFLFGLSIIAFAMILERFFYYKKINDFKENDFKKIKSYILGLNFNEALTFLMKYKSPISKISKIAIELKNKARKEIEISMELEQMKSSKDIFKYINILKVFPNLATLLGLLGTVLGMIKNFIVVASVGTGDPSALASGISEALITTATGLIIAIPLIFINAILENKAADIEERIQIYSSEVLKLIDSIKKND